MKTIQISQCIPQQASKSLTFARPDVPGTILADAAVGLAFAIEGRVSLGDLVSSGVKRVRQAQLFHHVLGAQHGSFDRLSGVLAVKQKAVLLQQLRSSLLFDVLPSS